MKRGVRSCLIMQHKTCIVELSFMETQISHDSINEGPLLITEGLPQTNVVYVPMSYLIYLSPFPFLLLSARVLKK